MLLTLGEIVKILVFFSSLGVILKIKSGCKRAGLRVFRRGDRNPPGIRVGISQFFGKVERFPLPVIGGQRTI